MRRKGMYVRRVHLWGAHAKQAGIMRMPSALLPRRASYCADGITPSDRSWPPQWPRGTVLARLKPRNQRSPCRRKRTVRDAGRPVVSASPTDGGRSGWATSQIPVRMSPPLRTALMALLLIGVSACAPAPTGSSDIAQRVVDVPTRPGVTQRFLLLSPREPKATVVLFAGDDGGLRIPADGRVPSASNTLWINFLTRSRALFVEHGLAVAIVDAPSDRQGFS